MRQHMLERTETMVEKKGRKERQKGGQRLKGKYRDQCGKAFRCLLTVSLVQDYQNPLVHIEFSPPPLYNELPVK